MSLGVLGLIAGLTIPNVVASVEKSKNRSVLKEDLQIISQLVQEAYQTGAMNEITTFDIINQNGAGSITNYFTNKLQGKQCLKADKTSLGCNKSWDNDPNSYWNDHNARWVMPNGSRISIMSPIDLGPGSIAFTIITDVSKPTVTIWGESPTAFELFCNLTDGVTNNYQSPDVTRYKPGTCGGYNSFYQTQLDKGVGQI